LANRFILLFLDGVGLGPPGPHNPLSYSQNLPFLSAWLRTPLIADAHAQSPTHLLKAIDATLAVPGLPQSATGQTTLYTGQNAAQFLGRHQTSFANGSLRTLIDQYGIFKQLRDLGHCVTLANLYSPAYFEAIARRKLRYSVGTLLNLSAGLPFRMQYEYEQGAAIFWDITGDIATSRGIHFPPISPTEAGQRLTRLAESHTLTLFECYLPDFAGHAQDYAQATQVLQRVDRFIESILDTLPADTTLIITSDHGNVEDLSIKQHTYHAVPLMVAGPQANAFVNVVDLSGIMPAIVNAQATPKSGLSLSSSANLAK
jgi:2,3-bisphosphoglycerate-independent phosphoglycerate mutase